VLTQPNAPEQQTDNTSAFIEVLTLVGDPFALFMDALKMDGCFYTLILHFGIVFVK